MIFLFLGLVVEGRIVLYDIQMIGWLIDEMIIVQLYILTFSTSIFSVLYLSATVHSFVFECEQVAGLYIMTCT